MRGLFTGITRTGHGVCTEVSAVNLARYLHERRGDFIDHRSDRSTTRPGVDLEDGVDDASAGARTRDEPSRPRAGYRPVRPAFAPSLHAPPLPYIEPWERR